VTQLTTNFHFFGVPWGGLWQ